MSSHSNTIRGGQSTEDSGSLSGTGTVGDPLPDVVATGSLVVMEGESKGHVYALMKPVTMIGRARSADVSIASQAISQQHARIERQGNQHFIVDLNSTNGTIVNGRQLRSGESAPLQEGDTISFADLSLIYLKSGNSDTQDVTQALQRLEVNSTAITSAGPQLDMAALIRLLQFDAAPPQEQQQSVTLDDLIEKFIVGVRYAKRYALVAFLLVALASLGGVASVGVMPPLAEASCIVAFRPEANQNPLSRDERVQSMEQSAQLVAGIAQDFLSEKLVAMTLSTLDKRPAPSDAVKVALKNLKFDPLGQAVYSATYRASDPKRAVDFLDAHVKNYLEYEIGQALTVEHSKVEFLTNQLRNNETQLELTEKKLKEFKQQNLEGLPEYAQGQVTSRAELTTKQSELRAQLQRSNLELAEARRRLAEMRYIPETTNKEAEPYKQALVEVNRKLSEAKAKGLGNEHPEVVALNAQAKRLQELVKETQNRKITGVELQANEGLTMQRQRVADLEVASKAVGAELGEVGGLLGHLNELVQKMPGVEAKYAEISRSYEASKALQTQLYEKLRSSEIQLAFQRASAAAQFDVPVPPKSHGVPIRRTLATRAGIGALIGLMLGLIYALQEEARKYLADMPKRRAQRLSMLNRPTLPR